MYSYTINEEIVRWAFEVFLRNKSEDKWWVAFTNPTAGPWKKIEAPNNGGKLFEIYRFAREEDRPDIIIVSDQLETILIIEAKDFAPKLIKGEQMSKSIRVIMNMSKQLRAIDLDVWNKRKHYKILPGFLWYAKSLASAFDEARKVTEHFKELQVSIQQEAKYKPPFNIIMLREAGSLEPVLFKGLEQIDTSFFEYLPR